MSPFKEPQPRKNSAAEDAKTVIGGNWPPYERIGSEASWDGGTPIVSDKMADEMAKPSPNTQWTMSETEFYQSLATAREEGRVKAFDDLEVRTTALEAAVKYAGNHSIEYSAQGTTILADVFENYLRNGKPS